MTARRNVTVIMCVGFTCINFLALGQQNSENRVDRLPVPLEVDLAISAAPPHLRAGAAVYVLDPSHGYTLERKGTNGFTCYVQRTDYLRQDFQ